MIELSNLFSPCYCVPIREAQRKLWEAADGGPTRFLQFAGKEILANDVKVECPYCLGTLVIPTEDGKQFLQALIVHAKKLQQKGDVPF